MKNLIKTTHTFCLKKTSWPISVIYKIFYRGHNILELFDILLSFSLAINTAKNTAISPNFVVWKSFGKAQFLHSFGRIARSYAETVPFHKMSTPGN